MAQITKVVIDNVREEFATRFPHCIILTEGSQFIVTWVLLQVFKI